MTELPRLDKILPCNLDAERAVLGAILLEPSALFVAQEELESTDLYLEAHRHVFGAMQTLQAKESAIDGVTLVAELRRQDKLEQCGGPAAVMSLTDGLPRAVNVRHYADLVREASIRRRLIQAAQEAMTAGGQDEQSSRDIIERLQLLLLKLSSADKRHGWIKASDLMAEAYREIDAIAHRKLDLVGLDTGFADLNKLTQGFHNGQLVLIAGRPGHGKTSLAMNIVGNSVLRHARCAAVFSIEMTALELAKRMLYAEAEVDSYRVGGGWLTKDDWSRINESAGRIANTKLFVDDAGSLTIMDLRSRIQQLAVESGVDLVVVDYLQLMTGISTRRDGNRVAEITEISRGLKAIAKDLGMPVIAVSQLSREVEKENRKPRLSDLRESGSLEQDADLVLFIWREELKHRTQDNEGLAELIIGKQRNGPVGHVIELQFLKHFTKFVERHTVPAERSFSYTEE